jgi:hypothetical protein
MCGRKCTKLRDGRNGRIKCRKINRFHNSSFAYGGNVNIYYNLIFILALRNFKGMYITKIEI